MKTVYQQYLTCQVYNLGEKKSIFVHKSLRLPSSEPIKHQQLNFFHLLPSMGCQNVLVIVHMFSRCVGVFPGYKADALTVAIKLLDVFST